MGFATSKPLFFILGATFATLLWPIISADLPSLKEVVAIIEHPDAAEFVAMLHNALKNLEKGTSLSLQWTIPCVLALLYLAAWIPYGVKCCRCWPGCCACSRPMFLFDTMLDAARPNGCSCFSSKYCTCRVCFADRERRGVLRRMARSPLFQLYVGILTVCVVALASSSMPFLDAYVRDDDGDGSLTLLEAVGSIKVPAFSAGATVLSLFNGTVLPNVAIWVSRTQCEAMAVWAVKNDGPHDCVVQSSSSSGGGGAAAAAWETRDEWEARSRARTVAARRRAHQRHLDGWEALSHAALAQWNTNASAPSVHREAATCAVDRAAARYDYRARALITLRRAFAVAVPANVALALYIMLKSSLRVPVSALVAFRLLTSDVREVESLGALSLGLKSAVAWVRKNSFGWLGAIEWLELAKKSPVFPTAASGLFAMFPAFAVAARGALPTTQHTVASDLIALHTAWAERHDTWRASLGAHRFAKGAACGALVGLVVALGLVLWRIVAAMCRCQAETESRIGLVMSAAWIVTSALVLGAATTMHLTFDLTMAMAPLAPFLLFVVFGKAWNALGGPAIGMGVTIAILGVCVCVQVGILAALIPVLQITALPIVVTLSHAFYAKYSASISSALGSVGRILRTTILTAVGLGAAALAAYITAQRTSATLEGRNGAQLFCKAALPYDPSAPSMPDWFGAFVNVLIFHSVHRNVVRLWASAQERTRQSKRNPRSFGARAYMHFRDACWAWAGDPPIFVLWVSVGSTGWWAPDLEPAVVLECLDVAFQLTTSLFDGDSSADIVVVIVWDTLLSYVPERLRDYAKRLRQIATFATLKASILLAQVINSASPWGCLPPLPILILCAWSLAAAAAASFMKHLHGLDGEEGHNRDVVLARVRLWQRSPALCGLCAATMPSNDAMEKFSSALWEHDKGLDCRLAAKTTKKPKASKKLKAKAKARADKDRLLAGALTSVELRLDAIVNQRKKHCRSEYTKIQGGVGTSLAVVETSSSGSNSAVFTITNTGADDYAFTITNAGAGYKNGDKIVVKGSALGGVDSISGVGNDCTLTVTGAAGAAGLSSLNVVATGAPPQQHWALRIASLVYAHLFPHDVANVLLDQGHYSLREEECEMLADATTVILGAAPVLNGVDTIVGKAVIPMLQRKFQISWAAVELWESIDPTNWLREATPVGESSIIAVLNEIAARVFPYIKRVLLDSEEREKMRRLTFESKVEEDERVLNDPTKWSWPAMIHSVPLLGPALGRWAVFEIDLIEAFKDEALKDDTGGGATGAGSPRVRDVTRETDQERSAEKKKPTKKSSGAFKIGLAGCIVGDPQKEHEVKLKDCMIYNAEDKTHSPVTDLAWSDLAGEWDKYDKDTLDPDVSPSNPGDKLMLRVRPDYLKNRADVPPPFIRQREWFPARCAPSCASKPYNVRYLQILAPTIGSVDNFLLIKQNKPIKGHYLEGEIKVIGGSCDISFPDPDDLQIHVKEVESDDPLDVHGTNTASVSIVVKARNANIVLDAKDVTSIEVELFGSARIADPLRWLVNKVANKAPVPITFKHVGLDVELGIAFVAPAGRDHGKSSSGDDAASGLVLSIEHINITSNHQNAKGDVIPLVPEGLTQWPLYYQGIFRLLLLTNDEGEDGQIYFNKITEDICKPLKGGKKVVSWKALRLAAKKIKGFLQRRQLHTKTPLEKAQCVFEQSQKLLKEARLRCKAASDAVNDIVATTTAMVATTSAPQGMAVK